MKKIYQTPVLLITPVRCNRSILTVSNGGITVNANKSVNTNFTKEENRSTYNIWDDDWNK